MRRTAVFPTTLWIRFLQTGYQKVHRLSTGGNLPFSRWPAAASPRLSCAVGELTFSKRNRDNQNMGPFNRQHLTVRSRMLCSFLLGFDCSRCLSRSLHVDNQNTGPFWKSTGCRPAGSPAVQPVVPLFTSDPQLKN